MRIAGLGGHRGGNYQVLLLDTVVAERLRADEDCFTAGESRRHG
jgi:hypothetical protein